MHDEPTFRPQTAHDITTAYVMRACTRCCQPFAACCRGALTRLWLRLWRCKHRVTAVSTALLHPWVLTKIVGFCLLLSTDLLQPCRGALAHLSAVRMPLPQSVPALIPMQVAAGRRPVRTQRLSDRSSSCCNS